MQAAPAELILAHVDKILHSRGFVHAEKLGRLLRYTVTETLHGRGGDLKEYVLGVEVFGRLESFDPRIDPIVRVQAGKLRARLKEYYEADGRDDTISVVYHKGSYVPEFEARKPPLDESRPFPAGRSRWRIPSIAAVLLLVVALSVYSWRMIRTGPSPLSRSIAVLPLQNLIPDPQGDYFSDGLTEELINALSRIEGLRVVARTSVFRYKGKTDDIRAIGAQLNVSKILEGTVRAEGDHVRVTARLVDTQNGYQLWSGAYDREMNGIFAIQDEITRAIVNAMEVQLATIAGRPASRTRRSTVEAYRSNLQGRYFWHRRTRAGIRKAIQYFEHALSSDPKYAEAWSGLADAYSLMAAYELEPLPKFALQAVAAARKAVELDGNLAEAHASLGFALATFAGEWADAETSFRHAIEINPGYATARHWYASSFLVLFGRLEEALRQMEEALSLDPVSAVIHYDLGRVFTYRREFDQAAQQFRKAIELDSTYARSHGELGFALEQVGELEVARKEFEKAVEVSRGHEAHLADLARFHAATGNREEALTMLESFQDVVCPYHLASVYAALGRTDEALRLLELGLRSKRSPALVAARFAALRDDHRYVGLLQEAGLREGITVTAQ